MAGRSTRSLEVTINVAAPTFPRGVSEAEIAVLSRIFEVGFGDPVSDELTKNLNKLQVVSACGCGCDSVNFVTDEFGSFPLREADGLDSTGNLVGVIIWGTTERVTSLEVFRYGEGRGSLPEPSTLRHPLDD